MRLEDYRDEVCPVCGKEFECLRLDQKYCSVRCRRRSNMRAQNAVRDETKRRERMGKTCVQCGVKFDAPRLPYQVYCSARCGSQARGLRRTERRRASSVPMAYPGMKKAP